MSKELDYYGGYSKEEVTIIKNTVAKGVNNMELAYFLNVANDSGLSPFKKEIWCYKDNRGNLIIFTGRDGFLKIAQKNPSYGGIRSSEVRENDEFSIDIANGKIKHTFGVGKRGEIVGAYCFVFRKDGEPTLEWADWDSYKRNSPTWKNYPAAMIKKVAESHALKKAFGIFLQSEHDFEIKGDVAHTIETEYKEVISEDVIQEVKTKIDNQKSIDDLKEYWGILDNSVREEQTIIDYFTKRKNEITNGESKEEDSREESKPLKEEA